MEDEKRQRLIEMLSRFKGEIVEEVNNAIGNHHRSMEQQFAEFLKGIERIEIRLSNLENELRKDR